MEPDFKIEPVRNNDLVQIVIDEIEDTPLDFKESEEEEEDIDTGRIDWMPTVQTHNGIKYVKDRDGKFRNSRGNTVEEQQTIDGLNSLAESLTNSKNPIKSSIPVEVSMDVTSILTEIQEQLDKKEVRIENQEDVELAVDVIQKATMNWERNELVKAYVQTQVYYVKACAMLSDFGQLEQKTVDLSLIHI